MENKQFFFTENQKLNIIDFKLHHITIKLLDDVNILSKSHSYVLIESDETEIYVYFIRKRRTKPHSYNATYEIHCFTEYHSVKLYMQ